jgi:hypothetical protein
MQQHLYATPAESGIISCVVKPSSNLIDTNEQIDEPSHSPMSVTPTRYVEIEDFLGERLGNDKRM